MPTTRNLAILIFEDVEVLDFCGPFEVVGHIFFSDLPITTEGGMVPGLALAPVAVLPAFQRQGVGSLLARDGLACAGRWWSAWGSRRQLLRALGKQQIGKPAGC